MNGFVYVFWKGGRARSKSAGRFFDLQCKYEKYRTMRLIDAETKRAVTYH
jgi:hypothetical protein